MACDYGFQRILTKEFLVQKYVVERMTTTSIGAEVGCSNMTIRDYLQKHSIPLRKKGRIRRDLTRRTFGRLTVLECVPELEQQGDKSKWRCRCECGNETVVDITSLGNGATRSCGCLLIEMAGRRSRRYVGGKYVSGLYWSSIRSGAKVRCIEFSLTITEIDELWAKQSGRCALTGLELVMPERYVENSDVGTASLDRIDSKKGYVTGNVQWVHKDVNRMKHAFPTERFLELCRAVVSYESKNAAQPPN